MKELNDSEFDQIFKNRIKEGYLDFEEESWLKMEKKLRSKNRSIFLRNASVILVFLSFGLLLLLIDRKEIKPELKHVKNNKKELETAIENKIDFNDRSGSINSKLKVSSNSHSDQQKIKSASHTIITSTEEAITTKKSNDDLVISTTKTNLSNPIAQNPSSTTNSIPQISSDTTAKGIVVTLFDEKINIPRKRKPLVLSINLGPDFNSTENTLGGKSGIAFGLAISLPITSKLSLQSGINYGIKNYAAEGYDYSFNNPNTVNSIAGIDASCNVLEIPLAASYAIASNHKNSISINAGLSSYIMLKENYRFIYTAASGRKDRFLEEKNANQHYLSVVDLSATYDVRLKNRKFAMGIQPYVKIPLKGIGEGKVPLKSSGISLKLNYELNKKQ